MKKSNGFVFIETIVVICVLTTTLVLLFSSYSYILRKSKEKNVYDTSEMIYKTYYVNQILENYKTQKNGSGTAIEFYYSKHSSECKKATYNSSYSITCDLSSSSYGGDLYQVKKAFEVDKIYYLNPKEVLSNSTWLATFDATTIDYLYDLGTGVNYKLLIVKYKKTYNQSDGYEVFHSSMEVSS